MKTGTIPSDRIPSRVKPMIGVFFLVLLAATLISCGPVPEQDVSLSIQEARAAFHQAETPGDCLHVAALYEEVLAGGFINGAVLLSQGNAYMRGGRKGLAVASYRRAERYLARDPHLQNNLELALGGKAAPQKRTLLDHLFFWQNWLSSPEKYRAAAAAAGVTFLLALMGLFVRRSRIRRTLTAAAFFVSLLLCASAALDWYRFDVTRHGVVVAGEVEARKGDSDTFARAFSRKLEEGTEFTLLEERGDWILVRLVGGPEGWIPKETSRIY
jgi:hypothetical protein